MENIMESGDLVDVESERDEPREPVNPVVEPSEPESEPAPEPDGGHGPGDEDDGA